MVRQEVIDELSYEVKIKPLETVGSWLQESYSRPAPQNLTAIQIDFILVAFSRPVRRNSLNATEGVHRIHFLWRAQHTLSREHMTAHSLAQDQVGKCKNVIVVPTRKSILSLMSLLNIPFVPFPSLHSAPSATSSRVSTSFPNRTRSWCLSPSAPARWSESDRMADPAPNTGYEPNLANFSSYVDPEHTPIDIPDSHQDFLCPDDATMISTSPEGLPNAEAFSSSQKAAAGRVSSLFSHSSLGKLSAGHVSSRSGLQETGADLDRDSVATTLFRSQSRGKRDRDRQRKSSKNILNGKLTRPSEVSNSLCKNYVKLWLRLR